MFELLTATATTGSAKGRAVAVSATIARSSAELTAPIATGRGGISAIGAITSGEAKSTNGMQMWKFTGEE
jgi:hypothetical protein